MITIGDIAEVKGGKRLPKGKLVQEVPTSHRYIRVTDFTSSGVNEKQVKYIDDETQSKISRYTISTDDVYISIAGTIGLVGQVPESLNGANLTENAAKICNIKDNYSSKYITYFLKSDEGKHHIKSRIVGTSQPKLALFRIKDIPLPKVDVQDQHKIAGVLEAYDNLITNNFNRIDKLESMARLLYRHYFDSAKFESKRFYEVAKINPEGIGRNNQPKTISYIDISSVGSGVIQNRQKLDYSNAPSRAKRIVKDGDLIWATVRPNRKQFAYVHKPPQNTVVSTGFAVLRPTKLPASYLYYFLSDDRSVAYLVNHATGSAYPAVNASVFENMPIPIPSSDLLQKYDRFVSSALKQIQTLYQRNDVLAQARDLLLPRLMSGEIKV